MFGGNKRGFREISGWLATEQFARDDFLRCLFTAYFIFFSIHTNTITASFRRVKCNCPSTLASSFSSVRCVQGAHCSRLLITTHRFLPTGGLCRSTISEKIYSSPKTPCRRRRYRETNDGTRVPFYICKVFLSLKL